MTTENLIKLKGLRTTYDKRSLSLQRYQAEIQALSPQTDKYAVARKTMLTGAVAHEQEKFAEWQAAGYTALWAQALQEYQTEQAVLQQLQQAGQPQNSEA